MLVQKLYHRLVMEELIPLLLIMVVLDIQLRVLEFKKLFLAQVLYFYQKLDLGQLIMSRDTKIYFMEMMDF